MNINFPIPKLALSFYGYLKKDLLLLYKRKKYLYTFLLVPIIISILFLLALNPQSYALKLGVCDSDSTELSQEAFSNLANFETQILPKENCTQILKEKIKTKELDIGIEVPKGFQENLNNLKQSKLIVYYDNTDIALANLLAWKVDVSIYPFEKRIIDSLNNELKSKVKSIRANTEFIREISKNSQVLESRFNKVDQDLTNIEEMETEFLVNPIWTDQRPVYEEEVKSKTGIVFVFPIIALFVVLMLASTSLIYDKNTGFITRVKSSTSPLVYLLAKITFFVLVGGLQFLIILALFLFEGARYSISPLILLKLILSVAIINSLLGILIGLISENEGIAVLFSLILSMPLMLVSGIFFPVQTMPKMINFIAGLMPLNYQITASKSALLFNQPLDNLWLWPAGIMLLLCWYLIRKKN